MLPMMQYLATIDLVKIAPTSIVAAHQSTSLNYPLLSNKLKHKMINCSISNPSLFI